MIPSHYHYTNAENFINDKSVTSTIGWLKKFVVPYKGEIEIEYGGGRLVRVKDKGKELMNNAKIKEYYHKPTGRGERTNYRVKTNPDGTKIIRYLSSYGYLEKLGLFNDNTELIWFRNQQHKKYDFIPDTKIFPFDKDNSSNISDKHINYGLIENNNFNAGSPKVVLYFDNKNYPIAMEVYFYKFDRYGWRHYPNIDHLQSFQPNFSSHGINKGMNSKIITENNVLLEKRKYHFHKGFQFTDDNDPGELSELSLVRTLRSRLTDSAIDYLEGLDHLTEVSKERYHYVKNSSRLTDKVTHINGKSHVISYAYASDFFFDYNVDDTFVPEYVTQNLMYDPVVFVEERINREIVSRTFNHYELQQDGERENFVLKKTLTEQKQNQKDFAMSFKPGKKGWLLPDADLSTYNTIQATTYDYFNEHGLSRYTHTNTGSYHYAIYCHDYTNIAIQLSQITYDQLISIPFKTSTSIDLKETFGYTNYLEYIEDLWNTVKIKDHLEASSVTMDYKTLKSKEIDYLYEYLRIHFPKSRVNYTHYNDRYLVDYTLDYRKRKTSFEYDDRKRLITTRNHQGHIINHTNYHTR